MSSQLMEITGTNRRTAFPLTKDDRPSNTSRIPVLQKCKNKSVLKKENRAGDFFGNMIRVNLCNNAHGSVKKLSENKRNGFRDKETRNVDSDVFIWKTEKKEEKRSEERDVLLWKTQVSSLASLPQKISQEDQIFEREGKRETTRSENCFKSEGVNANYKGSCLETKSGHNKHVEVGKLEQSGFVQVGPINKPSLLSSSSDMSSDNITCGNILFKTYHNSLSSRQLNDTAAERERDKNVYKDNERQPNNRDGLIENGSGDKENWEYKDKCGYKVDMRINRDCRGTEEDGSRYDRDRAGHDEGKSEWQEHRTIMRTFNDRTENEEGGSGYQKDRMGYAWDANRGEEICSHATNACEINVLGLSQVAPRKLEPKDDFEREQKENAKLRAQIETLSSFVESSEDLRERIEMMLAQQKEELEREIREKETLKNKVCCLEELRRNVQRKLDAVIEESKGLKKTIRDTEEKLCDEREKLKVVKKECSSEQLKNTELELVVETLREELVSANKLLKIKSTETETVAWEEFKAFSHVGKVNRYPKNSADYYNRSREENWKREKSQFEGKIKLLEVDKKRLRCHIDMLEEKIVEHERTDRNLRENNEILEFRIAELEYQVLELTRER